MPMCAPHSMNLLARPCPLHFVVLCPQRHCNDRPSKVKHKNNELPRTWTSKDMQSGPPPASCSSRASRSSNTQSCSHSWTRCCTCLHASSDTNGLKLRSWWGCQAKRTRSKQLTEGAEPDSRLSLKLSPWQPTEAGTLDTCDSR